MHPGIGKIVKEKISTWRKVVLGVVIARLTKYTFTDLVFVGVASLSLVYISYLLLTGSWWVTVIPAIFILALNGIQLTALYRYDQALQSGIKARQAVIECTFETIHNGPLQSLAKILKLLRGNDLTTKELLLKLEKELEQLDHDLRGIYELLQCESPSRDISLYLGSNLVLCLQDPLHEILYQVYKHTLERDFFCFKTIRVKVRTFEPLDDRCLSIEQKRGLCRFLEEALCNVGKHATGVTRLEVTCFLSEDWYTLRVVDDGLGVNSSREGRGTQQSINLAQQLQGEFRRGSVSPRGTICELSWPIPKSYFH
jgi:two-component sensor histidine kinase